MARPEQRRVIPYVAAALLLGAVVAILLYFTWDFWQSCYWHCRVFFLDKERVRDLVKSWGPWGPLVYIVLQAAQVVVAPLPGETTGGFVSGFLFGAFLGSTYSMIGLTLGSTLGFLLGRWLELHVITRWVSQEVLDRFQFVMERQGALIALLLFALPYFPKDYLCIILGLSGMPLKVFLVVVIIGRFPATILFNLQGAQLYAGNYASFTILFAVFVVLAITLYFLREPLYRWLTRLGEPPQKADGKG